MFERLWTRATSAVEPLPTGARFARRRFDRFRRLPHADRALFLASLSMMAAIRLASMVLSIRAIRRMLTVAARRRGPARAGPAAVASDLAATADAVRPADGGAAAQAIVVAVARAAAVCRAGCLVQALALEALLERSGHPAQLRIGFARSERGALAGHAWVESAGTRFGAGGAGGDGFATAERAGTRP